MDKISRIEKKFIDLCLESKFLKNYFLQIFLLLEIILLHNLFNNIVKIDNWNDFIVFNKKF